MAGKIGETKQIIEQNAEITGGKSDVLWNANQLEATSETHLEDDAGYGSAAIIRCFEFGVNPQAFKLHKPTKQELFNSHLRQIEIFLMKDGLKILTDVNPRIIMKKKKYQIFVGARPMKGYLLHERPKTLSQIAQKT